MSGIISTNAGRSSGIIGTATSVPVALSTSSNSYSYVKGIEKNSLGLFDHNFFGASYYTSAESSHFAHGGWVEVTESWVKVDTGDTTGDRCDDADPFSVFSGGQFTPTISGYYLCGYNIFWDAWFDGGEMAKAMMSRNGSQTNGEFVGYSKVFSSGTDYDLANSGTGILALDSNDYASVMTYNDNNEADKGKIQAGSNCWFVYVGTSDLTVDS